MRSPPAAPRNALAQRTFAILLAVLAVLLPALVAGVRIERPASEGEQARLHAALEAAQQPDRRATLAAHVLYAAAVGDDAAARLAEHPDQTVARARIVMLPVVLAVSALLYLLLRATRGSLTAMVSCLALAGLPPVAEDGHVLHPEPLACAFGLLGALLLATFAATLHVRRGRRSVHRAVVLVVMIVATGAAFGLSAAALAPASVLLLVPAGVVTLAWATETWTWMRLLRRRRLSRPLLPLLARRSWPWFGMAALGMASTSAVLWVLSAHGVVITPPTPSTAALLPPWPRSFLLVPLMVLGALRLLLETGSRLSARRVHPALVPLLFAAIVLMHHSLYGAGMAAILPACAAALLFGEGMMTAIAMLAAALLLRAQRRGEQG